MLALIALPIGMYGHLKHDLHNITDYQPVNVP